MLFILIKIINSFDQLDQDHLIILIALIMPVSSTISLNKLNLVDQLDQAHLIIQIALIMLVILIHMVIFFLDYFYNFDQLDQYNVII